ncbi:MAG: hypothetical protein GEU91_15145 [Rhizobiales bacterium]|nr:hypothetical protein [Hyphomicrobiales bacterium]
MIQVAKHAALLVLAGSLISSNAIGEEDQSQKELGDGILVGQGVVCDTVQQVARFTALVGNSSDVEVAVKTVNTEVNNPLACGVVLAAFVRGNDVTEVRAAQQPMKVVEITILAVPVGDQWHFVSPLKQYAAFPVTGVEI